MNKLLNVLWLCSLLLLAGGCRQDNFDGMRDAESSSDAIGFDIGFAPGTRVTTDADFESRWERGDAVGVFALDAATDAAVFTNEKLTYDGTAWKSAGDLRWKGRSLKFYAYYPYDAGATNARAIPFEVHSDQSGAAGDGYSLSDLMTAATGEQAAGSTVSLRFRHEMALLQVGIPSSDEGQTPGQTTAVRLTGVRTGATLNLTAEGGPSVQTATGTDNVKMYLAGTPPQGSGYSHYTYRALIPVQTLKGGSDLFLIFNEGTVYRSGGPDADLTLAAGRAELFTRTLPGSIERPETVLIPAGTFTMGSPQGEPGKGANEVLHKVTLTRAFRMCRYEITNARYAEFLNAVGVVSENGEGYRETAADGRQILIQEAERGLKYEGGVWKPQEGFGNWPVFKVSWFGADEYARWIGGRLPTEAEWEYACRAGTSTAWHFGTNMSELDDYAWYGDNADDVTHEVGLKKPNPWGLYDMYGNVHEWCSDWYDLLGYAPDDATDPVGPSDPDDWRRHVIRGSSWREDPDYCRSAYRSGASDYVCSDAIGLRVVFEP